ncbi:hypothetical protein GUITHDRAFT_138160 [Guillardia theta CCMP2712]|uniref:Uncharacterized protein n=1 Tax=Guillardia theta (strain CCMP2712) TaxID=905079 RepID=L1JD22_GUITC|nr:hypothetical protein GUITHDRAFT_138160 [Guillardia theta CCMP2712]EKX46406.1 hypothetical protein GUITHDRAFT_138160 [Guillardia theta CCMP2712]|eukprot:XP_005833386.1 hypothetical protein GUITHDRAFT_138160 [Guillardia theta CCMP2712]
MRGEAGVAESMEELSSDSVETVNSWEEAVIWSLQGLEMKFKRPRSRTGWEGESEAVEDLVWWGSVCGRVSMIYDGSLDDQLEGNALRFCTESSEHALQALETIRRELEREQAMHKLGMLDVPACQQQIVSYLPVCTWIGLSFIRSGQYERAMEAMEVGIQMLKLCDAGCVRPCLEAGIRCHRAFCLLRLSGVRESLEEIRRAKECMKEYHGEECVKTCVMHRVCWNFAPQVALCESLLLHLLRKDKEAVDAAERAVTTLRAHAQRIREQQQQQQQQLENEEQEDCEGSGCFVRRFLGLDSPSRHSQLLKEGRRSQDAINKLQSASDQLFERHIRDAVKLSGANALRFTQNWYIGPTSSGDKKVFNVSSHLLMAAAEVVRVETEDEQVDPDAGEEVIFSSPSSSPQPEVGQTRQEQHRRSRPESASPMSQRRRPFTRATHALSGVVTSDEQLAMR